MFNLGAAEIVMLCGVGVLIFGHKLPSVARSLGQSVISFKQGLTGIEDSIENSVNRAALPAAEAPKPPARVETPIV